MYFACEGVCIFVLGFGPFFYGKCEDAIWISCEFGPFAELQTSCFHSFYVLYVWLYVVYIM